MVGTMISGFYENGQIVLDDLPKTNKKVKVFVSFTEPLEIEEKTKKKRQFGTMKGSFTVPDDFNEPLDDLKDYM
ncbi:MAG: DUF2281 domain-containing protein [Arcicella sp.]|jgi:hypothetical protein|nr:DUF2281 domain-containing protein [Arcicella sp.]